MTHILYLLRRWVNQQIIEMSFIIAQRHSALSVVMQSVLAS